MHTHTVALVAIVSVLAIGLVFSFAIVAVAEHFARRSRRDAIAAGHKIGEDIRIAMELARRDGNLAARALADTGRDHWDVVLTDAGHADLAARARVNR